MQPYDLPVHPPLILSSKSEFEILCEALSVIPGVPFHHNPCHARWHRRYLDTPRRAWLRCPFFRTPGAASAPSVPEYGTPYLRQILPCNRQLQSQKPEDRVKLPHRAPVLGGRLDSLESLTEEIASPRSWRKEDPKNRDSGFARWRESEECLRPDPSILEGRQQNLQ